MHALRRKLVDELSDRVIAARRSAPMLVAIEGRSAAGKTSLADELAATLTARGLSTLRSSIDDFHSPGHKYRSIRREYTPESLLSRGYDFDGFRRCVIDPLGPRGDLRCKAALWNSGTDTPIPGEFTQQPNDVIALIDGTLLFHPALADVWHFAIWLHIDWHTMFERAAKRDVAWVASEEEVRRKYRDLWQPLHALYERTMQPKERCDVVVDNRDVAAPFIVR